MKRLLLGSMIAATLLLTTGCDDDTTPAGDTTAPVVQTADFSMTVGGTHTITANETSTFALSGDAQGFALTSAGVLTAPAVANTYALAVIATDTAGNPSAAKSINVAVEAAETGATDVNVTSIGGLTWTNLKPKVSDDADVIDVATSGRLVWADASAECSTKENGPWRLPTVQELSDNNATLARSATWMPAGTAQVSVVWSSEAADADADGNARYWGYWFDPAQNSASAQPAANDFYFSCVK